MTDPTAIQIITPIAGWISQAFTGLDSIHLFGFSVLDYMIAFAVFDITLWGMMRVIDSQKSDS